jgi:predicted transporter
MNSFLKEVTSFQKDKEKLKLSNFALVYARFFIVTGMIEMNTINDMEGKLADMQLDGLKRIVLNSKLNITTKGL